MRRESLERFPRHRLQKKPLVSDSDMHHGTCVTHVPWCMLESLTRGGGENVRAFPAHAQPSILGIWQEAHQDVLFKDPMSYRSRQISWLNNHIPLYFDRCFDSSVADTSGNRSLSNMNILRVTSGTNRIDTAATHFTYLCRNGQIDFLTWHSHNIFYLH